MLQRIFMTLVFTYFGVPLLSAVFNALESPNLNVTEVDNVTLSIPDDFPADTDEDDSTYYNGLVNEGYGQFQHSEAFRREPVAFVETHMNSDLHDHIDLAQKDSSYRIGREDIFYSTKSPTLLPQEYSQPRKPSQKSKPHPTALKIHKHKEDFEKSDLRKSILHTPSKKSMSVSNSPQITTEDSPQDNKISNRDDMLKVWGANKKPRSLSFSFINVAISDSEPGSPSESSLFKLFSEMIKAQSTSEECTNDPRPKSYPSSPFQTPEEDAIFREEAFRSRPQFLREPPISLNCDQDFANECTASDETNDKEASASNTDIGSNSGLEPGTSSPATSLASSTVIEQTDASSTVGLKLRKILSDIFVKPFWHGA